MIRLLFVGDGERDAATNPHLVERLVSSPIEPRAIPWPRLNHAGRGYDRKLLFALRQARQEGLAGVVAAIESRQVSWQGSTAINEGGTLQRPRDRSTVAYRFGLR